MTISSQLLNTTLNPANLGGQSVQLARTLVEGAAAHAQSGGREEFLKQAAAKDPKYAALAALLK